MKTLIKIARATLTEKDGYGMGDFTLVFKSFNAIIEKDNRHANSVFATFDVMYENPNNGLTQYECQHSFKMFDFGFVTPKGYKSTKVVPVAVRDTEALTLTEVQELKQYSAVYKLNTYDPFYSENEAARRNASAWNYIAANYITDPYCTR